MAIRTSSGSGNTHNSPFAFGSAVNANDQLIVANGHTVTRDGAITLGVACAPTPTTIPTISLSAGATVTSLSSGTYQFRYTFVDSAGNESHPTVNIGSGSIVNGSSKPRVTFPANPTGIASKNLYLSAAGGAAGTETLYATGITGTTYDLVSASWTDGTTTQAAAAALPNKAALQINGGGAWVEGDASVLTATGDVIVGATSGVSSFTCNAGGTLRFDPSGLANAADTSYRFVLGNFNNFASNFAKLLSSGTSRTSRYRIETASGSNAPCRMVRGDLAFGGATDSAFIDVSWVDLVRCGSSSISAVQLAPSSIAQTVKWQGGIWDTCGAVDTGAPPTNSVVRWRDITTVSTVGVVSGTVRALNIKGTAAIGTGERHIGGCCFGAQVLFTDKRDWTIGEIVAGDGYGNVFYKGYANIGSNIAASFIGNFTRPQGASDEQPMMAAETDRLYCFADYADLNPHLFGGGFATTNRVKRSVFEYTGSDDNGDCVLHLNQAQIYEIDNCIITKNGAGTGASGTLITSGAGVASQKIRVRHCTAWAANQSAVSYGEGAGTIADQINEVKSNLVLVVPGASATTSAPFVAIDIFAGGVTDVMTPANACYNCFAGGVVGTGGSGVVGAWYKGTFSTPPGANDIGLASAAAVGLVNGDARVTEWDQSLGGSGSRATCDAHALAELMKRNDATGYDSRYSINALLDYVFAGFAPTNTAVRNAGHDGITIGASEGVWPGGGCGVIGPGLCGSNPLVSGGLAV